MQWFKNQGLLYSDTTDVVQVFILMQIITRPWA